MITIFFDGLCEPNPNGVATYGFVILGLPGDHEPLCGCDVLGSGEGMTNNVAEYTALGKPLAYLAHQVATKQLVIDELLICGDSKLVIEQLYGRWNCNVPRLVQLRDRCRELLGQLGCPKEKVRAEWIPRDQNVQADAMSRAAYVGRVGKPVPARSSSPLDWHRGRVRDAKSAAELDAVQKSLGDKPEVEKALAEEIAHRREALAGSVPGKGPA